MRTLFDELRRDGFAIIRRLIEEQQQEGVSLDFKEKVDASHGRLTKDDRQTLAENLSAFANSAGGLLIFGVVARKDEQGVDAASDIRPISQLARFQSEVTHSVGELLLPRHEGVEVVAISDPEKSDTGCLAVWVDRSERRPHQSQAAKDRRYYKRSGDSSFVMEHYDIEDAIRRIVVPDLSISFRVEGGGSMGGGFGMLHIHRFVFSLQNESLVTARFPYLHFDNLRGLYVNRHVPQPVRYRQQVARQCFDGVSDDIIHPDLSLEMARLELGILTEGSEKWLTDLNSNSSVECMTRVPLKDAEVGYMCAFGAEHCRTKKQERTIPVAELLELIK